MSVSNENYKDKYAGIGATGPYPITFPVTLDDRGDARDVLVLLQDATGVETDITSTSTIAGLNVSTAVSYDSTYTIVLVRRPTLTQPYTFPYLTKFPSQSFEDALDRLTFLAQRLSFEQDQSLKAALSDDTIDRLPTALNRASKFLAFDVDGQPFAAEGIPDIPASAFGATLIEQVDAENARATLGVSYAEIDAEIKGKALREDEVDIDTTLVAPGRHHVSEAGGVTLPASAMEGDILELMTDQAVRVRQNHASAGISFRRRHFTTKGVYVDTAGAETGYLQTKPGSFVRLAYRGAGENRIEPPAKLADPATLPASAGVGASFSPDGNYLAVPHTTTPYITIYKRSGDTFTKLADPATLPAGNGQGAGFSPDGNYLAVGHSTTPFITIYKTIEALTNAWVAEILDVPNEPDVEYMFK